MKCVNDNNVLAVPRLRHCDYSFMFSSLLIILIDLLHVNHNGNDQYSIVVCYFINISIEEFSQFSRSMQQSCISINAIHNTQFCQYVTRKSFHVTIIEAMLGMQP